MTRRYPSPDQAEPLPLSDEWLAQYRTLSAQWATYHQDTDADQTTFALAVAVGPLLDEVERLRKIDRVPRTHDGVQIDKAIHPEHRPA